MDQSLGAYYHLLLPLPPFPPKQSQEIVSILNAIPATIERAKQNLSQPALPFAQLALDQLKDVGPRLLHSVNALKPLRQGDASREIDVAAERAARAPEWYGDWLSRPLSSRTAETAVGRDGYTFFLKNVALMPFTPRTTPGDRAPGIGAVRGFAEVRRTPQHGRSAAAAIQRPG